MFRYVNNPYRKRAAQFHKGTGNNSTIVPKINSFNYTCAQSSNFLYNLANITFSDFRGTWTSSEIKIVVKGISPSSFLSMKVPLYMIFNIPFLMLRWQSFGSMKSNSSVRSSNISATNKWSLANSCSFGCSIESTFV